MKTLYDHQIFSLQKYGGISKYFCELIKNIPPEHQSNLSLIISDNEYLKEENDFFKKRRIYWPAKKFKGKHFLKRKIYLLNRQYSKRSVSTGRYDLLHPTFYDDYFLSRLKRPYVITVHDLIAFKFEDDYAGKGQLKAQMEKVIKNSNRIISVSGHTKKDIIDIFDVNPEKIDVVHHGFNKPSAVNRVNPFGKYILFVGRRARYKNFSTFIAAISGLLQKEKELKLVCVGHPFSKEERADLVKFKISEQTTALTADENTLNNLFANALIFVYPSLYEGFGMPILEAFANNCPVCLSDASCFPEIAGDAGIYFNPRDHGSISKAVEKVLYDDSFKSRMIAAGTERLEHFSWKKTANETLASYKKVICA
jgi:glycosyltransferase involved in cell wall biosynthesis